MGKGLFAVALVALAAGCGGRVGGAADAGESDDAAPGEDGGRPTPVPEAAPADVAFVDDVTVGDEDMPPPDASSCYQPSGNAAPAHFQLVIDGMAVSPFACPSSPWDYPVPQESRPSVVLVNDGAVPIAYTASPSWSTSPPTLPGAPSGPASELFGVLDPGMKVDISSTFTATAANGYGVIAVVGSASPFTTPVCLLSDQGLTNWPAGVGGSGGSSTMYVVQLASSGGCKTYAQFW